MSVNYFAQAEAVFRQMLAKGKPVAFEDAAKCVPTPKGFDRRGFGHIPAGMARRGEIVEAGYRRSVSSKHNCAIKRLWILASTEGGAK